MGHRSVGPCYTAPDEATHGDAVSWLFWAGAHKVSRAAGGGFVRRLLSANGPIIAVPLSSGLGSRRSFLLLLQRKAVLLRHRGLYLPRRP